MPPGGQLQSPRSLLKVALVGPGRKQQGSPCRGRGPVGAWKHEFLLTSGLQGSRGAGSPFLECVLNHTQPHACEVCAQSHTAICEVHTQSHTATCI